MKKALVIFSGGQDSTTCLGWALDKYDEVEAISFQYGQMHSVEIQQSKIICEKHNVKQTIVDISFFGRIVESALTSDGDVNKKHAINKDLPASFVPNRNAMFITIAHSMAQKIGADNLVTGVCETDYSGYPDCRMDFIQSIQMTLNLASDSNIIIDTPLMYLDKKQVWELSDKVRIFKDVQLLSHTCYNGDRTTLHEWGYGCDDCPACKLRKKGFYEYKNTRK